MHSILDESPMMGPHTDVEPTNRFLLKVGMLISNFVANRISVVENRFETDFNS